MYPSSGGEKRGWGKLIWWVVQKQLESITEINLDRVFSDTKYLFLLSSTFLSGIHFPVKDKDRSSHRNFVGFLAWHYENIKKKKKIK
jgi:hypothetical protein